MMKKSTAFAALTILVLSMGTAFAAHRRTTSPAPAPVPTGPTRRGPIDPVPPPVPPPDSNE